MSGAVVVFPVDGEPWITLPRSLARVHGSGRFKVANEGVCRMCLRPAHVRPLTRHHIIAHSWFLSRGGSVRTVRNACANIVPLCRACHDCVDHRDAAVRVPARRELRRSLTQTEIAFAIHMRGKAWFDRFYPRTIVR